MNDTEFDYLEASKPILKEISQTMVKHGFDTDPGMVMNVACCLAASVVRQAKDKKKMFDDMRGLIETYITIFKLSENPKND